MTILLFSRVVVALAPAVLLAGCGDEAPSPTAPEAARTAAAARLSFDQVSAGVLHVCGVATDGSAWCWGYAGNGQLGNATIGVELCGNSPCSTRPVAVSGGLRFRHVSSGWDFTCGVTTDDRIYCWGVNDHGELGTSTPSRISTTPVAIAGNRRYRQVRAGGSNACAITMSRDAFCWGDNQKGQLGNGSTSGSQVPVRVGGPNVDWTRLTVGQHACGIATDGRARCWGVNVLGELGDGTTSDRHLPVLVAGNLRFSIIEAGPARTCAVSTAGKGYCWGSGIGLGDGSNDGQHLTPNPIVGNRKYADISAGNHTCGVSMANVGFCWGENGGTLGDGGTADAAIPVRLAGNVRFKAISAGGGDRFDCGVATDGRAWCWGRNQFGNLGDGTTMTRSVPTLVAAP